MQKKGCCRECKYADWDADGCTCMIDGRLVYNASDYTCDQYRPANPLTNADRIRQMADEELAKTMRSCKFCAYLDKGCQHNGTCTQGFLEWLKQEVSEDATERTD